MTPQERQEFNEMMTFIQALKSSNTIPAEVRQAFIDAFITTGALTLVVASGGTGASSLSGILHGNGTSPVTAIAELSGIKQYFVSDTSGGPVTRRLTFNNGVLTSET